MSREYHNGYRVGAPEDCGSYDSNSKIYSCTFCNGYGWLGYSKQEMCQVCDGRGKLYKEEIKPNS